MSLPKRISSKIRREAKYLGRDIGHLLGLDEQFFRNARGSRILIYHGICLRDHTRFNPIFLKLNTLKSHLQFYQKYFNVITLDEYYNENFSKDKFNVCLTFDDGYANNHKYVLPLLKKYQTPATFFVTAIRGAGYDILWNDFLGIIGKYGPKELNFGGEPFYKGRFDKYISKQSGLSMVEMLRSGGFDIKAEMMRSLYPMLPFRENKQNEDYWLQVTEGQIRELAASPFATVGAHSYYHNDLAQISLADATAEMRDSKQFLESIVNKAVTSFAFPYGTYTRDVVNEAKNCGYDQLLAMDFHFAKDHQDSIMRERFTVNPFISPINQMHATITRAYER